MGYYNELKEIFKDLLPYNSSKSFRYHIEKYRDIYGRKNDIEHDKKEFKKYLMFVYNRIEI